MRSKLWTVIPFSAALLAGCATTTPSTDWTRPILFNSTETIYWLAENDEDLLRQIVTHNEQVEQLRR